MATPKGPRRKPVKAKAKPKKRPKNAPAVKAKKTPDPKRAAAARLGWQRIRERESAKRAEFERRSKAAKLGHAKRKILGAASSDVESILRTMPDIAGLSKAAIAPLFPGQTQKVGVAYRARLKPAPTVAFFAKLYQSWARKVQTAAAKINRRTLTRLRAWEGAPDEDIDDESGYWLTASSALNLRTALLQMADFAYMESRQNSRHKASGLVGFILSLEVLLW